MSGDRTIVESVPAPPARPDDGHKGTFGTVIVIGGCPTMPGAPALCARAALRGGVGLVKIASDEKTLATSLAITPSATGVQLTGDTDADVDAIEQADANHRAVLAVGPGWGLDEARMGLLTALLENPRPIVLDADGLNALSAMFSEGRIHPRQILERRASMILTPHPGEFRRLSTSLADDHGLLEDPADPTQRAAAAAWLATALRSTVVLKGRRTVVSDASGRRVYCNASGNPALATAGTGDVLTGLIAALLARKMASFEAACLGVFTHGKAADIWTEEHGRSGLLAQELSDQIPRAMMAR
ncbi:MAG: NAD(P)H-hydrate dehydratase [Planctomycetota bacterium]